ncbi:hypothetical protein THAOC_23006, partial [Thalassiosira oceanica]
MGFGSDPAQEPEDDSERMALAVAIHGVTSDKAGHPPTEPVKRLKRP